MYEVRELEAGLALYIPDMPDTAANFGVYLRAYVDGREVSGSGEGRLRPDDLKILKLITDTKSLCTLTEIKEKVWGAGDHEEKLKGAIFRLRTIGLRKLKDNAKSVIQNVPRKGYIYVGQAHVDKADALPDAPHRDARRARVTAAPIASRPLSPPSLGRPAGERPILRSVRAVTIGGLILLIAGVLMGYQVQRWISSDLSFAPNWERMVIQGSEEGRRVIWGSLQWMDIAWVGDEGWLCDAITVGGGGGYVGIGVLLHTTDKGNSWSRIDQKVVSGIGTFRWGTFLYSWEGVGPLWAITVSEASGARKILERAMAGCNDGHLSVAGWWRELAAKHADARRSGFSGAVRPFQ